MAKKWTEIADTQVSNDTDEFVIVQTGVSRRTRKEDFLKSTKDALTDMLTVINTNKNAIVNLITKNTMQDNDINNRVKVENFQQSIINRFTGTTQPPTNLGKNGDTFHRFASSANVVIQAGTSAVDMGLYGAEIFVDNASADVRSIYIDTPAGSREVYVDYGTNNAPSASAFVLTIAGVDIPLTVQTQTNGGFIFKYPSGFDSNILSISIGETFNLSATTLSGTEEDYTKKRDKWYNTPIFSALFEFAKVGASGAPAVPSVTGSTLSVVNTLAIADLEAGTYIVTYSNTFGMDSTNKSFIIRRGMKIAGNAFTFQTSRKELKDTSDKPTEVVPFVYIHGGGDFELEVAVAVEGGTGVLYYSNIVLERKA